MSFDVHGFRRFSCLFFLSFEGHSGLTLRLIEVIFLFVRDVASVFSEQLVLRQGFDLRDDFIVTVLQANEHDDQGDNKRGADDASCHEDPESPCSLDTLVSRLPRSVVIFIAFLNRHVIDYFISVPVHMSGLVLLPGLTSFGCFASAGVCLVTPGGNGGGDFFGFFSLQHTKGRVKKTIQKTCTIRRETYPSSSAFSCSKSGSSASIWGCQMSSCAKRH